MLFLAATLDRLIFKFDKRPWDLAEAGFKLSELIPADCTIDFRNERLNHVLRDSEKYYGDSYRLIQLRAWLSEWDALTERRPFKVRIDASHDQSKLLATEYLAGLFSYELPEINVIDIAAPRGRKGGDEFESERIAVLDASGRPFVPVSFAGRIGTDRNRFVTSNDIARRDAQPEDNRGVRNPFRYDAGLTIVKSEARDGDALGAFLTASDPVRAPAAVFIQQREARLGVTARLLDAVMERADLVVAGVLPSTGTFEGDTELIWYIADRYQHMSQFSALIFQAGQVSARQYRDVNVVESSSGDWEREPLILSRRYLADDPLVDPRTYLDELLGGRYADGEYFAKQRAIADSAAQRGITQIDTLRQLRQEPDKRYVQLQVHEGEQSVAAGNPGRKTSVLRASATYTAEIFLDSIWSAAAGADRFFSVYEDYAEGKPEAKLEVIFTPLFFGPNTAASKGQIGEIVVPRHGRSSSVRFLFSTPEDLRAFRVRIVIVHQTVILQTLIFALEPLSGDIRIGIPYRLVVESNLAQASTPVRPESMRFDLSLILNDDLAGEHGMLAIQGSMAVFAQALGWDTFVSNIQKTLDRMTRRKKPFTDLFDDEFLPSLRALADHGSTALTHFRRYVQGVDTSSADNIQIVEAVSGAFFPVEFFYEGEVPSTDAPICEHAREALLTGLCANDCTRKGTEDVLCPLAFWGMSKRIQRMKADPASPGGAVSVPVDIAVAPRSITAAQMAASERVTSGDLQRLEETLKAHVKSVLCVQKWKDWSLSLARHRPDLLVLLPHSDSDPIHGNHFIEIGSDHLTHGGIREKHVATCDGEKPIVLLLGCDTAATRGQQFTSLAGEFLHRGALTVVATLSEVFAQPVSVLAGDMVTEMASIGEGASMYDFGTLLLLLKRRMLSTGNALALTLVCYGDTSWYMKNEN